MPTGEQLVRLCTLLLLPHHRQGMSILGHGSTGALPSPFSTQQLRLCGIPNQPLRSLPPLLQGTAWDAVRQACVVPPTPLIQAAIMAKVVR